ncbi:FapA family protein [Paenibacillus sp. HB172176]|uniref:DUF342 domain-containing protein n=1 Tax=Paenibacillus sp. HB172176 TaxID=2493690 RepID=UPI00143AD8BB|nr:FapA family protein [Paenibacillus sp. HB172176]
MMDSSDLESYLRVQTSADKLSAFLTFSKMSDEFECRPGDLESFLKSHGVVFGIKLDVLNEICKLPLAFCKEQTLVAQGKNALPGKDGTVRFVYDMSDNDQKPSKEQNGKVNLKEVSNLKNVTRGMLIAELVEPLEGEAGMTVTGEELASKLGKRARFKLGKNVVLNNEQTAMYAALDGLITITDKSKINVFPVYEVNGDVNYSVGNIDFVGTVVIRGNVLNGFRVKASGDIRVVGGVEGAELESEGSIDITGGIMASGKGFVKAGRNVKCSFVQEGNVYAAEDVIVSQSIMHSMVKAGRSIYCSGAKGLIVGGSIQAGDLVSGRTIGNAMSTATSIEVGVNPSLREEMIEQRARIKESRESIDKTDKALVILDQLAAAGQLSPERQAMRIKLNATKRQTLQIADEAKNRVLEIEKILEGTDRSRVDVSGTIYGGTKIVIGRYTKFVKDSVQKASFQLKDGDIAIAPYVPK